MLFVYDAFHDKRLERLKRRLQKDIPVECGDVLASVLLSDELKKCLMNKKAMLKLDERLTKSEVFTEGELCAYGFSAKLLERSIFRCSKDIRITYYYRHFYLGKDYSLSVFAFCFMDGRRRTVKLLKLISSLLRSAINYLKEGKKEAASREYVKMFYWLETLAINVGFLNNYGVRNFCA